MIPGDFVTLKAGDMLMLVLDVYPNNTAKCEWFFEGERQVAGFDIDTLRLA